jgi:P-type conjugative transfer protein TrbG
MPTGAKFSEWSKDMKFISIIFVIAIAARPYAAAQEKQGSTGALQVKRKPAPSTVDRYDFGAQVKALEGEIPAPASASNASTALPAMAGAEQVPKDFKPRTDVPLTQAAKDAVRVTEKWMAEPTSPSPGPDGRVLFSYGTGLPTVVCAPLRVCMIELQTGEKLVGEPHIGDSVRWNVSPALYGQGDSTTSIIVLKPSTPGLDTNLLITTDRRAYYLRLISKPEDYVARVAFAYPDDESGDRKWQEHLAEQRRQEEERAHIEDLPDAADALHFNYRLKGGDENIRPVRVFDDGKKTYIQMPAQAANRELPVLVVIGASKKPEMVNYRVKGSTYIVDRLFDRAQLVLGAGKKAQKVEITHEP